EIEAGDLKLCEGPALPALVVTVTRPRESSPAVAAVGTIIRQVVGSYCKTAGPPWAIDLQAEAGSA
ncbi:LysR family transcriptional regulator, partial [Verminephrobacter sp. Larva24]